MNEKNIKKVFDQIEGDESMKARMLEKIYIKSEKELNNNKVVKFKYKKPMSILAASLVIVSLVSITNNKWSSNKPIDNEQGTSEMIKEELAVKGRIDNIEASENGTIITVGDIKVLVHGSTNIFKNQLLLNTTDLVEGQSVEVYYDGVPNDLLNGLRIEILQ